MKAGHLARHAFDINTVYMPHLSLLYSDIDQSVRRSRAAGLQMELEDVLNQGLQAESIALWRTPVEDKSLQSWELVEEYPLSGP